LCIITEGRRYSNNKIEPIAITLKDSDFPSNPRFKDHYLKLNAAAASGVFGYIIWTFWPPKSHGILYEGMDKVLTGSLAPAQFCQQLNDAFKTELKQGRLPRGSIYCLQRNSLAQPFLGFLENAKRI
jgi:hypothetical protein